MTGVQTCALPIYRDDTRITLFPPQDYHTLRANMKSLRLMAGLRQDLVYHMGRHSFASLVTLEEGVPIETISKMLGHSNIKTTQIYARVTPKRLFEDMDMFMDTVQVWIKNGSRPCALHPPRWKAPCAGVPPSG